MTARTKSSTAKPPAKPAKSARATPKPAKSSTRATKAKPAAKAKPARRAPAAQTARPSRKPAAPAEPARRKPAPAKHRRRARAPEQAGEAVAAVKRDLEHMPTNVAESAEAATALAMASRLDSDDGSPSECAKALLAAMAKLRAMAPPEKEKGALHDIRSGRAIRLAAGSSAD